MDQIQQQLLKATRLNEITQRMGFALWQFQELEGVSAQYFVLVSQATQGMGLAAGNKLVDKAKSKPFGATVQQLAKKGLLSTDLEQRFRHTLSERNWLVHRSRADSRDAIHSDVAQRRLTYRVDAMADDAHKLLKTISELTDEHMKKHGVPTQEIEAMTSHLLEQWHASDLS